MPPESAANSAITSVLREDRVFLPAPEFSQRAHIKSLDEYQELYRRSIESPETFWGEQAEKELVWFERWHSVLNWNPPLAQWFSGGRLNVSYNCLDRWLNTPYADKPAIVWEGEPWDQNKPAQQKTLTYRELHQEVCRFANVLLKLGIRPGDRVIIYLPM
ncbi:MAG TPA: acetyl-coenzyme A synthetase N-terminal domain-containing protein, partial [Verrucomicrobiota bacterium]|nr:acetyl-coenzyme A synthetase N-terminal domain-containing protein [Verrucomicrobiota bacterium]